ncbi:Putative ribosomal protein S13-like, H2TH [Septoria linicola]|uniref:Ribosomal protein S13-like, H2TH n=1 Tax=Septoria linicola TaxID=215465 RepID=A0A9Q9ACP2_9PEZI|nr:Putative ribosomal protein S13-like, H2TH [Septoria linicola]
MPEIGEVARMVHYLRKHLVHRTITTCQAYEDSIVYGKKGGTDADTFGKALTGRKVTGAGTQGKYFWLTFDKPPHSVMHLGMTGWIKCSAEETAYYKRAKVEDQPPESWPPEQKWTKWLIKCDAEGDRDAVELAFMDARRLGRIGLVDCDADDIRHHSPLKENGPDPFVDKDIVTVEWLSDLLNRKKVPVKALLLDQANISGIGNWVADEIMYQAKLHPEQYSNTFNDQQIKQLHDALIEVTTIACETLADSSQFPETWLMKYRWDKGKKGNVNKLPSGNKIEHITVGGRTSAFVPAVQKKTAAVTGDVDSGGEAKAGKAPAKGRKRKVKEEEKEEEEEEDEDEDEEEVMPAKKSRGKKVKTETHAEAPAKKARQGRKAKAEPAEDDDGEVEEPPETKKPKSTPKKAAKPLVPSKRQSSRKKTADEPPAAQKAKAKTPAKQSEKPVVPGERRSTRGKK